MRNPNLILIKFFGFMKSCISTRKFEKNSINDPQKWSFLGKNRILRLFALIHNMPFLNQESVFSLRKCQIRFPRMFLPLEGSFPEKNCEKFFHNFASKSKFGGLSSQSFYNLPKTSISTTVKPSFYDTFV